MKTIFNTIKYSLVILLCVAMTSCDKEDIGSTATVNLAGEWMVTIDAVDTDGKVVMEDPFGLGSVLIITYNSAANRPDEIFVDDLVGIWDFRVKVPCDASARTFGSDVWLDNLNYDSKVRVSGGTVVVNGAKSPAGYTADAISFNLSFDDDDYPEAYGYDHYLVNGYRRTGLAGGND